VHERYRQTDGRTTTYSEHEHEFTFAKTEDSGMDSKRGHNKCIYIRTFKSI